MASSTSTTDNRNEARAQELRKKAGRFRILIVGRANSGKTTILQKICKTDDEPEIFNSQGEKVRRRSPRRALYILMFSIRSTLMLLNRLEG